MLRGPEGVWRDDPGQIFYLVRTVGSLSGGTRVTVVEEAESEGLIRVEMLNNNTATPPRRLSEWVNWSDLVVPRKSDKQRAPRAA